MRCVDRNISYDTTSPDPLMGKSSQRHPVNLIDIIPATEREDPKCLKKSKSAEVR